MRAALRQLCKKGEAALRPSFDEATNRWRKPAVSKRIAAVVRKHAVQDGTFGSFDPETGKGWDPKWDSVKQIGTMQLRPNKMTARQRSRESRAQKIEGLVEQMDDKIDENTQVSREARSIQILRERSSRPQVSRSSPPAPGATSKCAVNHEIRPSVCCCRSSQVNTYPLFTYRQYCWLYYECWECSKCGDKEDCGIFGVFCVA
jgi:hypothetical protein